MRKLLTILLFGSVVLSLTACGVKKGPHDVLTADAYDTARTYGMQDARNYRGGQSAFYKNPMRAPTNQVYYFSFDSSHMRSQDLRALMLQAKYLVKHPNVRIRLEGNTDNRGSREYNIGLAWKRDQSVARLLKQQGVRPNQIQMVSYGKERPAVNGNSETAWALNRRVNLIYKAR